MAGIHALNSASKGEAWPMLLTIAPKKSELEFLITTPIAPQG